VSQYRTVGVRRALRLTVVAATLTFGLIAYIQLSSGAVSSPVTACEGANLAGVTASSNVYAGGAIIVLAITNIGTSACQLGGYPTLLGIRGGHEYALSHVGEGPTQDGQLHSTVLRARQAGALILNTTLGCNANATPLPVVDEYTGLVILLPHHQGHVKILGVPLSMPCGVSESALGWAKGFVFD
jgi:hypothetical protein